jgi:nucleotide-binding universal stress UspA family protein
VVTEGKYGYASYTEQQMESYRTFFHNYLDGVASVLEGKGLAVRSEVVAGKPIEEVIAFAVRNRAGLVAMSTHWRWGIRRWGLGSVADGVLREGSVPVLLVRIAEER